MGGVTVSGVTICPVCGKELNIIQGGQENTYSWETAECLGCQLAILVHYEDNETTIWIGRRAD